MINATSIFISLSITYFYAKPKCQLVEKLQPKARLISNARIKVFDEV